MLSKAALSIRRKFNYLSPTTTLYLQMDNARGHGSDEAKQQYIQILRQHHIEVVFQPPRSLECNMLDLGFWMSMQSGVHKAINRSDFTFDADTIWTVCKQQFESFDSQKIINFFNRLKQDVWRLITRHERDNFGVEERLPRGERAVIDYITQPAEVNPDQTEGVDIL